MELFGRKMSAELTTKAASHLLRRLHTLLILGKRSNTLALAIRRALEEIRQWPQSLPFSAHFEKRPPRLVFAGYGPKFIKMIQEMMDHGSIAMLDTLQADVSPFFCELCELPGIGETVARRMFYDRMIESFEDLRVACANHVLESITGFGETRIRIIEAWILAKAEDPDVAACDIVVQDAHDLFRLGRREDADIGLGDRKVGAHAYLADGHHGAAEGGHALAAQDLGHVLLDLPRNL